MAGYLERAPGEERRVGEEARAYVVVAIGWRALDVATHVVVMFLVAGDSGLGVAVLAVVRVRVEELVPYGYWNTQNSSVDTW